MSSPNNGEIDPQALWGDYQNEANARAKDRRILANKMRYKSLNIPYDPDDPMNVDNSKVVNGIGTLGAMGIALAAGLPLAALAAYLFMNQNPAKATPVPTIVATSPAAAVQLDSNWDEVIYAPASVDANGQPVPEKIISRTHYRSRSGVVEKQNPDGSWVSAPTVKPQ